MTFQKRYGRIVLVILRSLGYKAYIYIHSGLSEQACPTSQSDIYHTRAHCTSFHFNSSQPYLFPTPLTPHKAFLNALLNGITCTFSTSHTPSLT
jgi:hypothetical protein